ncbi:MAG: ankyrin repeat domain-containing protein [Thermodesulfobacteriota bacterium]|nr:ankyrin repeat domain-containing protein [Thermodesulfobacteriota bacterium]
MSEDAIFSLTAGELDEHINSFPCQKIKIVPERIRAVEEELDKRGLMDYPARGILRNHLKEKLQKAKQAFKKEPERAISIYRKGIAVFRILAQRTNLFDYWRELGSYYCDLIKLLQKNMMYAEALREIEAYETTRCMETSRVTVNREIRKIKCKALRAMGSISDDDCRKEVSRIESETNKREKTSVRIHDAARKGKIEKVKEYLESDKNLVNLRNREGETPIFAAVSSGNEEMVELLILNGADINVKEQQAGTTPLYWATRLENTGIIDLLLSCGANINEKIGMPDREQPIIKMILERKRNLKSIPLLLSQGAEINMTDRFGITPLHVAVENGNYETIKMLIDYGANINAKTIRGETPFDRAFSYENVSAMLLLLKNGAECNNYSKSDPQIVPGDNIVSIEDLPYPMVLYPGSYGTFFVFFKEEEEQLILCACAKEAVLNYLRFRLFRHCPVPSRGKGIIDEKNFPKALAKKLIQQNAPNDLGVIDHLKFEKGICHECNRVIPKYRYCSDIYGGAFKQTFGWYINKQAFEFGIRPIEDLSFQVNREICPQEILDLIESDPDGFVQDWFEAKRQDLKEATKLKNIFDKSKRRIWNVIENEVRQKFGYRKVGETWITETILYYIVQSLYAEKIIHRHYRPDFLGGLEIDIFIKDFNLGIEYQGIQHFSPVNHWGGEEGLKRLQERDIRKKEMCDTLGISLIYFRYDENIGEEMVKRRIQEELRKRKTKQ